MKIWFGVFVAAVSLVSLSGCGGGLATATASGVVLYNGKPLPGASVIFVPEQGGPASTGLTGSDGSFTLTMNNGSGALIGKHGVAVQSIERYRIDGKPIAEADQQVQAIESDLKSPYRTRSKIPVTYGNQVSSGLTAEVGAGSENRFTFELVGK